MRVRYAIYGSSALQRVVLYNHGFPGSIVEGEFTEQAATLLGLSVLVIERPGLGESDFDAYRKISDWPAVVAAVLDHLGVSEVDLLGVSGGAPYATIVAARCPERTRSLTLVSPVAPPGEPALLRGMMLQNKALFLTGRYAPWCARCLLTLVGLAVRSLPSTLRTRGRYLLLRSDRTTIGRRAVQTALERNITASLSRGIAGARHDFLLLSQPWGFDLGTVRVPRVTVYHGDADTYVPPNMGKYHAQVIPGAHFVSVPKGGHFMVIDLATRILQAIVDGSVPPPHTLGMPTENPG